MSASTPAPGLQLSSIPDAYGFLYGMYTAKNGVFMHVNLMPPGPSKLDLKNRDPKQWLVFVGYYGKKACPTRADAEAFIRDYGENHQDDEAETGAELAS